jgi:ABC-2 type transport system permease protein
MMKLLRQRARLLSALVRPALWLLVYTAGAEGVVGGAIPPPYRAPVEYPVYIVPGLLGLVLLFNGMQSSLSLVYERETGFVRLLLTAPLPRWFVLLAKLVAAAAMSVLQAYCFLAACLLAGVSLPWNGMLWLLPTLFAAALMLAAVGLALSVHVRQLENFAGIMNFVIFPMFFLSPALYPLWKFSEAEATTIHRIALANPFTYAVELIRFALYGQFNATAAAVVAVSLLACFSLAVAGYDRSRRRLKKRKA